MQEGPVSPCPVPGTSQGGRRMSSTVHRRSHLIPFSYSDMEIQERKPCPPRKREGSVPDGRRRLWPLMEIVQSAPDTLAALSVLERGCSLQGCWGLATIAGDTVKMGHLPLTAWPVLSWSYIGYRSLFPAVYKVDVTQYVPCSPAQPSRVNTSDGPTHALWRVGTFLA